MNQYLPNVTMLITACRKGEKRPVWYVLHVFLLIVGITYWLKNGKRSVRWRRRIFRTVKIKISSIKKGGITTAQRLRIGGAGVRHIKQAQIICANISLLCTLAMYAVCIGIPFSLIRMYDPYFRNKIWLIISIYPLRILSQILACKHLDVAERKCKRT